MLGAVTEPIAVVGVPTALGGQLPADRHVGMADARAQLRRRGFLDSLAVACPDLRSRPR
jgi:hypothetical protein